MSREEKREPEECNSMCTPADRNDENNQCSVCFERFDITYSQRLRCWVLVNAVKLEGLFYHPTCVDKAWDGINVDFVVSPHLALRRQ